jgi:hypothetical protein
MLMHTVFINGVETGIPGGRITYEQIVHYAGYGKSTPTVTYHWRGKGDVSRSGAPHKGESFELADGMIISVVHTGNA